jgi:hypothetical protein
MARTEHRQDTTEAPEHAQAVGVFRPSTPDDGRAIPAPDHQQEIRHLGRDAARRALVGALVLGVAVAVLVGVIVAVTANPGAPIAVGVAVAAGAFAAALGGLWGSFSRLGTADDWRKAVTDHVPPPRVVDEQTGRPTAEPAEARPLEDKGAAEIHVVERPSGTNRPGRPQS